MMTDPRNQHVKHYINGRFVSQYEAAIPLFDAGFLHGKQVWSAPRLINNHIFRFQDHLDKNSPLCQNQFLSRYSIR